MDTEKFINMDDNKVDQEQQKVNLYPSRFRKISIYRGYTDKDMLLSWSVNKLCKRCREENR